MNTCGKCGKGFYSDVDYEQHLLFHEQSELLAKSTANITLWFNILLGCLQFNIANNIADRLGIPFEEAAAMYFARQETWNRITDELKAKKVQGEAKGEKGG